MTFDVRPLVVPATTALLTNEVQPGTVGGGEGLAAAGARVLPNITAARWRRPVMLACKSSIV